MTVMTKDSTDGVMSRNYDLVALKPALAKHLPRLDAALGRASLLPDRKRKGFFEIHCGRHWFYIYIRAITVYLVAHRITRNSPFRQSAMSPHVARRYGDRTHPRANTPSSISTRTST